MTLVEKRQKRGALIEEMRTNLALETPDLVKDGKLWDEQEKLGQEITDEEKRAERLKAIDDALKAAPSPDAGKPPVGEARATPPPLADRVPKEYRALVEGPRPPAQLRMIEALVNPAYPEAFRAWVSAGFEGLRVAQAAIEKRGDTLQVDLFTKGGALVPPLEFINKLINGIDDETFIRSWATRMVVTQADGVGIPTLEADPADADWTSELATGNVATMDFGRRELHPHPLAKRLLVSKKLLRAAPAVSVNGLGLVGVEELVRSRLAYKFALTAEKAYLSGDGVNKPLGLFTASASGIPTSRDVSVGNSATGVTGDGLLEAKYSIKAAYQPRLRWLFHRDALKMIRKLKDGNGNYIWTAGLTNGTPDRIFDAPYAISEWVPNTFTTGLYVGIIGDFSWYWIVDALDFTLQRLNELYAEQNSVGFIGRLETDGAPVLAEAFSRIKLA